MVAVDRKFDLELVSPERLLLSEPVDMAVIPGSEGDFGVLAGHSLLISTLRPGVIEVYQGDIITHRLFVGGGFAEVTDTRCTVLADDAVPVGEIDAGKIQAEIEQLQREIADPDSDEARRISAARLAVAEAEAGRNGQARKLMRGRPRHRGAAFRLLALSLSSLALSHFATGCAQPGDPATLRAAFLSSGDIMAHVPKIKGLGIDTPQPLARGAPEPIRTTVRFASNDDDLYGGAPTIIEAALFRPAGAGPFPAIVALHDCLGLYGPSGAMTSHMRDWAERLVAQGYAVILPDSFNPRGVPEMCSRDPDLIRPGVERARDAAAALGWLQAQPWIAPDRVGLVGWANGGTTALTFATTDGRLRRHYGQADFRLIVAFYPNCAALARAPGWRSDLPLTIFAGGQDDWAPAKACVDLAARIQAVGGALDLVKYFMAHHDFDAPGMPVHFKAGVTTTASGGAIIGTDPMARADAVQRVSNLLAGTLRP